MDAEPTQIISEYEYIDRSILEKPEQKVIIVYMAKDGLVRSVIAKKSEYPFERLRPEEKLARLREIVKRTYGTT